MRNLLKIIISALQTWTNKRIQAKTPDWQENNSSADGYIKNRPFYEEANAIKVIELTADCYDPLDWGQPLEGYVYWAEGFTIVPDNNYIVVYDGVEYEATAHYEPSYENIIIGNDGMVGYNGSDNGIPFAIGVYSIGENYPYVIASTSGIHTFAIFKNNGTVHKINKKYLPKVEEYLPEGALRPDYDIFDENQIGYIKNRPFYYLGGKVRSYNQATIRYYSSYVSCDSVQLRPGFEYVIEGTVHFYCQVNDGKEYTVPVYLTCTANEYGDLYFSNDSGLIYTTDDGVELYLESIGQWGTMYFHYTTSQYVSQMYVYANGVKFEIHHSKKLDANVIPNEIARVEDVPAIDATLSIEGAAADAKAVGDALSDATETKRLLNAARPYISLIDEVNGYTYLVSMCDGTLVSSIGTKSIKITKMPDKTDYTHSEYFDPTGMIVMAICYDGTLREVTDYTWQHNYLVEGATSVDIMYVESGVEHTAKVPITVSEFDPATVLVDFTYTDNGNGTYTITGWKKTYNGVSSTELIIPNYGCILV